MIELLEQRNLGALEASVCAALCPVFVGSGGGGQDIGWFGKSFIEAIQKGE